MSNETTQGTLPTFLIPGAAKSGTTSLWNYLKAHPDIGMGRVKEPAFFSRNPGRYGGGGNITDPTAEGKYDRGIDWYRSLFEGCEDAEAVGEASTLYFIDPDSPELIKKHLPDVRLIFILRDPVDRLYSHYWQSRQSGWEVPDSFQETVETNHPLFQKHCRGSSYRDHLRRYIRRFDRSRIKIFIFEDLKTNPVDVFQASCRFLGVDPSRIPESLGETHNKASTPRFSILQKLIRTKLPGKLLNFITSQVGSSTRKRIEQWKENIKNWNRTSVTKPPLSPELKERLRERFVEDVRYVEDLIGRPLDEWRTNSPPANDGDAL